MAIDQPSIGADLPEATLLCAIYSDVLMHLDVDRADYNIGYVERNGTPGFEYGVFDQEGKLIYYRKVCD